MSASAAPPKHQPFVPATMEMKEFTFRAVFLGMLMTGVLGAANAYLGLKAGMTIAATYPAAVIAMAVLRLMKGSILEENIARTVGSIGESVAAGAVFTIPAFVLAGLWPGLGPERYWESVALMVIGGTLGILFVTLLRRVMVEDPELPFPESVAASQIHKAGQQGATAAKILFANMGFGAVMYFLSQINLFWYIRSVTVRIPAMLSGLRIGRGASAPTVATGGMSVFNSPAISPAYLGVGYIIGPRLAALNFAGGVIAWGLLVPLLVYFLGPSLSGHLSRKNRERTVTDVVARTKPHPPTEKIGLIRVVMPGQSVFKPARNIIWIRPTSERIFKIVWTGLMPGLPQFPTTTGAPRRLNRDGPRRMPIRS